MSRRASSCERLCCCCWRQEKATDELTAEQQRRAGGISRKLSIMKAAGSLIGSGRESGSQGVEAGGLGAALFILNFEERMKWITRRKRLHYPKGRRKGSAGRWGVQEGDGGVPVEKVAFCSSSLFNQPFFGRGKKNPDSPPLNTCFRDCWANIKINTRLLTHGMNEIFHMRMSRIISTATNMTITMGSIFR